MRRVFTVGIASMLAAVALAACGSGPANEKDSKGLTELTIGIVPFSQNAVLFHAMDSGIFEKHGLKVKTEPAASPIEISAAMVSGKQQFGFITTPVLINANLAGTSMKCVSPVAGQVADDDEESGLVASKASGITSLEGFANQKVATVQLGSINRLGMEKLFDDAGVKGVQYVAIPFPQMPQALADGRVAGAQVSSPFVATALDAGAKLIMYPNSVVWKNGTIYCFAGTQQYLDKNAKTAQAFQDAMKEAILYAKDHQDEVLKTLVKHMQLTPEVAAKQSLATNFVPEISLNSIKYIQDEMKKFDWIKTTVDANDLAWSPAS